MRTILLVAVLTSAISGPASAQTLEQQWARCRDDNSERLIPACTAVIRSGREPPANLARAFFHRGRAWSDNGQDDRAIQDFDQSIRLDPRYPDAFNARGVAYAGKGQFDRAIEDYDQAIQLDPNYAIAIYNRGLAARNLGREEEATTYFVRAKQAGPRLMPPKQ